MHLSIYKSEGAGVEDICYDEKHAAEVLSVIKKKFIPYFENFVDFNASKNFGQCIKTAIKDFDKDRESYEEIFAPAAFEEYEDDPNSFKTVILRDKCPIIRKTLYSGDEELKKYRKKFNDADPNELLEKIANICAFGRECRKDASKISDIGCLDEEDFSVYGVIGGGIKTTFLYKLYPDIFPGRSKDALWALYFLSGQGSFGCEYDSEFLMVDDEKIVTQQNYFYPCELFYRYAVEIYKLLAHEAEKINLPLDENYRYVVVDAFLKSVAEKHDEDINIFKSQIPRGGLGYVWS